MKLYSTLENLLKTENNFIDDDGHLKKWVIINKAQNITDGQGKDNAEYRACNRTDKTNDHTLYHKDMGNQTR